MSATVKYKGDTIATIQNTTKTLQTEGKYMEADVVITDVSSGSVTLQEKTNIDPTTSSQTITPDSGYDGLSSVQINAMPTGTAGTPTATKGTVSNHSISVTPSVTNSTGYITGGTKTGTAVSVSASELVSDTLSITENGTANVTNYASVNVNVSGGGSGSSKVYIGTSDTAAAIATKVVTCEGFTLEVGAVISVKFQYGNSASLPKLNVNGTGAKYISEYGAGFYVWREYSTLTFFYDGTNYVVVSRDESKADVYSVLCNTGASTASKDISAKYMTYNKICLLAVTFTSGSTSDTMSLNVGDGNSRNVYKGNAAVSASNPLKLAPNETAIFTPYGGGYIFVAKSNGYLPSVSTSDNGKVLTVVSGAWAAATATPANLTTSGIVDSSGNSQLFYGRKTIVSTADQTGGLAIQTGKTSDTHTNPATEIVFRDAEVPTSSGSELGTIAATITNSRTETESTGGNMLSFGVTCPTSTRDSYGSATEWYDLPTATSGATSDARYKILTTKNVNDYFGYVDKTLTNVAISANSYASLGNLYSVFGIPSGAYVMSFFIRGWSGAKGALELAASSDGNTLYVMATTAQTITSITVRVWYMMR